MLLSCINYMSLAQFILFAVPDRSSLVFNVWDCYLGFKDFTAQIAPLQKPNTTFLSLTAVRDEATGNANVYIMFDSGGGPQVEEWAVPEEADFPWVRSSNVNVDFRL